MESLSTTTPAKMPTAREAKQESLQRVRRRSLKMTLTFWSFVGPLILGLLVFFFIPIIWSIVLSFADARATITPSKWVGFENYQAMLNDPEFIKSLATFTIFALFIVPLTFICALGLALLVNSIKFAECFFR